MHKKPSLITQKFESGFTLIELMVTVVILGILAAIAMPMYSNYITKAKARNAQSDLVALSLVIESLYQRNLKYIASTADDQDVSAYLTANRMTGIWQPAADTFDYKITATTSTYTLKAIGRERNANCDLTLDNKNERTFVKTSGCGGLTSW
ncbi:type IV pilin protein [Acinetobacter terrestris]|uniref:type IV pilin protein n=1 Tax=Acinetobacter terrestris TaxID=2529843 RepID=UPI00103C406B|nr:type IV pilin protein [Acinetobacter terrestris]TCB62831.1 prepilin-type N-terminal cleavage/methylation domain-containing protein [Acinetobacter terrestris]